MEISTCLTQITKAYIENTTKPILEERGMIREKNI